MVRAGSGGDRTGASQIPTHGLQGCASLPARSAAGQLRGWQPASHSHSHSHSQPSTAARAHRGLAFSPLQIVLLNAQLLD